MLATSKPLKCISKQARPNRRVIDADSLSALQYIQRQIKNTDTKHIIRNFISEIWTPAYSGIIANDNIDRAVKTTKYKNQPDKFKNYLTIQ